MGIFDSIKIKYICSINNIVVNTKLINNDDLRYVIIYNIDNMYENIRNQIKITKSDSQKIDDILLNSTIPIITKGSQGVDGFNVEITFKSLGNEVSYKWRLSPNFEWRPLEKLINFQLFAY